MISHGFCLGDVPERERDALLARMAAARHRRHHHGAGSRAVPPLMACRAAGVTVFAGNDGIRDTWTPYGMPDMLERAMLVGLRNNLRRDDEMALAFDCVTARPRAGCGFADYGLAPGAAPTRAGRRADCAEAVVARPPRRWLVAGRISSRATASCYRRRWSRERGRRRQARPTIGPVLACRGGAGRAQPCAPFSPRS